MANIAFIKLFTGMELPFAQLSAELLRAGHTPHIYYYKEFIARSQQKEREQQLDDKQDISTTIGDQVSLFNYRPFTEMEMDLICQELDRLQPAFVGYHILSGMEELIGEFALKLKARNHIPVIMGGAAPTLTPEKCIRYADMLCINEGEKMIVELADRIDRQEDLTSIPGTWVKQPDGTLIKNPRRPLLDLDEIAIPCWDPTYYTFIDDNQVFRGKLPRKTNEDYVIMTQRGCPFSCSFCIESRYQELFDKKGSLRRRSPALVIEELVHAKMTMPLECVLFYDNVFTINPRWLDEFLPAYKEKIGLPFWCYTYPTTHNRDMLKKLAEAGCVSITMGVQTGSEKILEHYNRPTKIHRIVEAGREIVEAGIEGTFDLITRGPYDTEEDLWDTFEFLLEFPPEIKVISFGHMSLFPTYALTRAVAEQDTSVDPAENTLAKSSLPDLTYDFYHKLYLLTRTDMDRAELKSIARNPRHRHNPALLDKWLEEHRKSLVHPGKFLAKISKRQKKQARHARLGFQAAV